MLLHQRHSFHSILRTTHAPLRSMQKKAASNKSQRLLPAINSSNVCRAKITPNHKIPFNSKQYLQDNSHVLRPWILFRYNGIVRGDYDPRKEGLWIMGTANNIKVPRVVRAWTRRRMIRALIDELKERGFDRQGKRLKTRHMEAAKLGHQRETHYPEVLVGTVNIGAQPGILSTAYKEVREQAGLIADEILRICGQRL